MGEVVYKTVEFVLDRVVIKDFVVNIVDGQYNVNPLTVEIVIEMRFVGAVAFTGEPFDTVAVNGVAKFLF